MTHLDFCLLSLSKPNYWCKNYGSKNLSGMNHFHLNSEPNETVLQKTFTMRARANASPIYVSNDHHFLKSWQSLVPQLELLAALVGARLANFVSRALKPRYPNLKVKLWSDSEIVLHWLRSIKQLKPFIGNRTREIKSLFPLWEWNHCPTNENPADLLTRGINTTQLHSSALWTHGPHWLPFESHWPS